jgi:hypothetical protein
MTTPPSQIRDNVRNLALAVYFECCGDSERFKLRSREFFPQLLETDLAVFLQQFSELLEFSLLVANTVRIDFFGAEAAVRQLVERYPWITQENAKRAYDEARYVHLDPHHPA